MATYSIASRGGPSHMRVWPSLLTLVPVIAGVLPKPARVEWVPWFRGIMAGFIGGGAGAFAGGLAGLVTVPEQINFAHPSGLLKIMGGAFAINGLIHMCAYLAQKPIPDIVTVTTTETVTHPPSVASQVTKTVETTARIQSDNP